jgi:hypothetical protein
MVESIPWDRRNPASDEVRERSDADTHRDGTSQPGPPLASRVRLDEELLPDQSRHPRVRQRLGIDVVRRCVEQIVDLRQEASLNWGRELHIDATKVEANAGVPSRSRVNTGGVIAL